MKILHLYAPVEADLTIPKEILAQIPEGLGVVSPIQYVPYLDQVTKQLKDAIKGGQILGCRVEEAEKIKDKVKGYLYVGTGHFHPIGLYLKTQHENIWCYNPETKELKKLDLKDVENFERERKVAKMKFLHANKVGIIVTTKTGQNGIRSAMRLKERTDKEYFVFATDTLNYKELENFPYIDCWVNTACPRIADEKSDVVNIADVREFLNLAFGKEHLDVNQLIDISALEKN